MKVVKLIFFGDAPMPTAGVTAGGRETSHLDEVEIHGEHGWEMRADFRRQLVLCEKRRELEKEQNDPKREYRSPGPFFAVPFAACRFIQFEKRPVLDDPQGQQKRK